MQDMIETLESRTLLTASLSSTLSNDLAALRSDVAQVHALYVQDTPLALADLKSLVSSIKAAGGSQLIAALKASALHYFYTAESDLTRLINTGAAGVSRVTVADLVAQRHPSNALLAAVVGKVAAAASARTTTLLDDLGANAAALGAATAAKLGVIATQFASDVAVATAVANYQNHGSTFINTLGADVNQLATDVGKFFSDAAQGL